jgi:quinol monooxygenase YgiN
MIYLKISFEILPEKQQEFEQAVPWLIQNDQAAGECVKQQLLQESGITEKFVYLAEWSTRHELESHLRSDRFRALWGGMTLLGKINEATIVSSNRIEDLKQTN